MNDPLSARERERTSSVRLVRDLLRVEVASGRFPDGVLPAEDQLMHRYDVSRGVVRDALQLLRSQGLLERVRGAGTFVVAPAQVRHHIEVSQDISGELAHGRSRSSWEVLGWSLRPAPGVIADRLGIGPGDAVFCLERRAMLDGLPLSMRSSWLTGTMATPLLEPGVDLQSSLYLLLEETLGIKVGNTELVIEAANADSLTAAPLGVKLGTALFRMQRTVFDRDGGRLEYSIAHSRSDRMALVTVMQQGDRTS
jgi:GntR family transcriptional regulator